MLDFGETIDDVEFCRTIFDWNRYICVLLHDMHVEGMGFNEPFSVPSMIEKLPLVGLISRIT